MTNQELLNYLEKEKEQTGKYITVKITDILNMEKEFIPHSIIVFRERRTTKTYQLSPLETGYNYNETINFYKNLVGKEIKVFTWGKGKYKSYEFKNLSDIKEVR